LGYQEYWDQIYEKQEELQSLMSSYWSQFSHMGTWQFWVVLAFLVLPLILLYFTVDRKRIFEVFFFGFVVHMLWTYVDLALSENNFFFHTYFLSPLHTSAFSMTGSALPVGFLLLYQYCTNHQKNFYLYTIILSFVFAFVFLSINEYFGLIEFNRGMNQFYVFLIDIVIVYIAYWFTKFILKLKESASSG